MTEISLLTNPVRRYLMNLNDRRRMKRMYPHHPMQKWERVVVAVFVVLMFAGLILSFWYVKQAEAKVVEEQQLMLGFMNRCYVFRDTEGHVVFADSMNDGQSAAKRAECKMGEVK